MIEKDRHIIHLSHNVVRHLSKAVQNEIACLERIGVKGGDEWPSDYDPNDLAIYRSIRTWLDSANEPDLDAESLMTRPVQLAMDLVPHYVRNNLTAIARFELDELFRCYCEYVAMDCLIRLAESLKTPGSSNIRWIETKLTSLLQFFRESS